MSKRGTGLAILALLSMYQLNKRQRISKGNLNKQREMKRAKANLNKSKTTQVKNQKRRTPLDIVNEAESKENENKQIVYIVGKGKKFHYDKNCRGIRKNSNVKEMYLKDVKEKGYELCGWERSDK